MKKIIKYLSFLILLLSVITLKVSATSNSTYVNLNTLEYSLDNNNYKNISEYSSLEDFLKDYKSGSLPDIYITNFLFDGVSSVKTPDLDDFIENDSNDTIIKTLEIKVININTTGNIEFTGEIKGAMIGVNTNNRTGNINIILNGVNINTGTCNICIQ